MRGEVESRQIAYRLLDQLEPSQLDAVIRLLEVMVEHSDDGLSERDRAAVSASREYFRRNPGGGVPFEQVLAECGFTTDEVRNYEEGR